LTERYLTAYRRALCNRLVDKTTCFWAVEMDIPELAPWLTPRLFTHHAVKEAGSILQFAPLERLEAFFPGDDEADSVFRIAVDGRLSEGVRHHHHEFSHIPIPRANVRKPIVIEHAPGLAKCVIEFFELACAAPLLAEQTRLYPSPLHSRGEANYVEVSVQQVRGEDQGPPVDRHDLLFAYDDIGPIFGVVMRNWLATYDSIVSSIRLHSQVLYSAGPAEYCFLLSMFALEAYSRDTSASRPLDGAEFTSDLTKILDSVPSERVSFWRRSLAYTNEHNLRDRLFTLRDARPAVGAMLHLTDGFLRKSVDTRNSLVHQLEATRRVWKQP